MENTDKSEWVPKYLFEKPNQTYPKDSATDLSFN